MRSTPSAPRSVGAGLAALLALALTTSLVSAPASAADPAPASAGAAEPLSGLAVLLTNDDSARGTDVQFGTNGKGLYELRRALCGAGADVLVVAPWNQQSGAGARMTVPGFSPVPLTVQAVTPPAAYADDCEGSPSDGAVFGVCLGAGPCLSETASASPADAVNVALSRFAQNYWAEGPDVVLSGVNFGQNVGTMVNHSGTVGAVVTAHEYGVPAIALSAEVPFSLELIPQIAFAATADFAVDLLAELVQDERLTGDLLLNVNHPFLGAGDEVGEAVSTVIGTSSDIGLSFAGDVPAGGGTYQLSPGGTRPETRDNADTTALAAKNISLTHLDADWTRPATAPPAAADRVATRIEATVTPMRDRKRPYVATVTGQVVGDLPAGSCSGAVVLSARGKVAAPRQRGAAARRVVVRGANTARLRSTSTGCRFSGKVRVQPHRAALATRPLRGTVPVRVVFVGNERLRPSRTQVRFRIG